MGYVPDGLSPEQWAKMKKDEATKKQNLGGVGVDGKRFKSRSMESFMKALESGKGGHLFPVNPEKVKSGEIPLSKVPYMQRKGGSWDNSDIRGGKKSQWLQSDREYAYVAHARTHREAAHTQSILYSPAAHAAHPPPSRLPCAPALIAPDALQRGRVQEVRVVRARAEPAVVDRRHLEDWRLE